MAISMTPNGQGVVHLTASNDGDVADLVDITTQMADSVGAQLSQKAASVHTHTLAQVTGASAAISQAASAGAHAQQTADQAKSAASHAQQTADHAQQTADGKVNRSGDTMSGDLTISSGRLRLGPAGYSQVVFRGNQRYWIGTDPGASNSLTIAALNATDGYSSGIAAFAPTGAGFGVPLSLDNLPSNGVSGMVGDLKAGILKKGPGNQVWEMSLSEVKATVAFANASSRTKKADIVDDENVDALALRPRSFRFSDEWQPAYGDRDHLGFVAEEVAEVDPRLATWDADGGIIGLDHSALIAALVGTVKSQAARIDALEARIAALEGGTAQPAPAPAPRTRTAKKKG